jgi:hypothetical protein
MKWFNGLPADDPRRKPFFQSAIQTLAYHPQAAEQFSTLSGTERASARTILERMSLPEDRRRALLDALAKK